MNKMKKFYKTIINLHKYKVANVYYKNDKYWITLTKFYHSVSFDIKLNEIIRGQYLKKLLPCDVLLLGMVYHLDVAKISLNYDFIQKYRANYGNLLKNLNLSREITKKIAFNYETEEFIVNNQLVFSIKDLFNNICLLNLLPKVDLFNVGQYMNGEIVT